MAGLYFDATLNSSDFNGRLNDMRSNIKQTVTAIESASESIGGLESSMGNAASAADSMVSTLMKVGGLLGVGTGLGELAKNVFNVRSEFQDAESTMKVFLGSAEKATSFMSELKDYAWYNMFEFTDLVQGSKQLLAYGNTVEKVIPILDNLSNVATGTKVPLMEMVNAYNHAKNAGGLDRNAQASWAGKGLVLNDILDEMGEKYDKKFITFDQLNKVLEYVTRDGGMFGGLMDEQMDNLSASYGQLQDNIANMFNEIGVETQDYFKEAIDFGANLVDNYKEIIRILAEVAAAYGGFRAGQLLMKAIEDERKAEEEEMLQIEREEADAIQAKIDKQRELLELTKENKEFVASNDSDDSSSNSEDHASVLRAFDEEIEKREQIKELAEKTLEDAKSEVETADKAIEAAQAKVDAAKEYADMWKEANEASEGANDDEEFEAQLELERAQLDLNTASEARRTAAKKVEEAQEKVNIATTNLSVATTNRETAANVTATGAIATHSTAVKSDTIFTKAATGAKLLFNSAVRSVTNSLKALKIAIVTNPLGALAVAVMAVYEAYQYFTKSAREAEEAQQKFHDTVDESTKSIQAEYEIINSKSLSTYKQRAESLDTILKAMKENNIASKETIDSLTSEADKLKYVNAHREELISLIQQEAAARAAADMKADAKTSLVKSAEENSDTYVSGVDESTKETIKTKNAEMLASMAEQYAQMDVLREKENWSWQKFNDEREKLYRKYADTIEGYGNDLNMETSQIEEWQNHFNRTFSMNMLGTVGNYKDHPIEKFKNSLKTVNNLLNDVGATENTASGKTKKYAKEVENATNDYNTYSKELKKVKEELEKDPGNVKLEVRKKELTQDLNDAKERVKEAAEGMNQDIFLKVQAMVDEEGVDKYKDFINDNREEWDKLVDDIKNKKIKFDGDTTALDEAYHKVLKDMDDVDHGNPCPEFSADITDFMSKVSIAETKEKDFPHVHDFILNFKSAGEAVINSGIDALNKLIEIYNKFVPDDMKKKKFEHFTLSQGERPTVEPTTTETDKNSSNKDDKKKKKNEKKSKKTTKVDKVELSEEEKAQQDLEDVKTEIARKAADARAEYEIAKTHDATRKQIMEYEEQYKSALQAAEDYAEEAEQKILEKMYNSQQIKTGKNSKDVKKWSDLSENEKESWRKNLSSEASKELSSSLASIADTRSDMLQKANIEYSENVKKAYADRTKREAETAASWASYYEKAKDYAKRIEFVKKAADKDIDSLYEQLSAATRSDRNLGESLVSAISSGDRNAFDSIVGTLNDIDKNLVESLVAEILNRTEQKNEDVRNIEFEKWQKDIGWETLFNDTEKYSKSALEKLLPNLRTKANDDKIPIDQRKTIIDLIKKIEDELEKGTFAKSLKDFKEGYGFTDKYTDKKGNIVLDANGNPVKQGTKFDPIQFANRFAEDFGKAAELAFKFGLDPESKAGRQLQSASDGLNAAAGAAASFMSGDYVGAVLQSVDAIKSFAKVFSPGNVAEMQAIIDMQNAYMDSYALQMEMSLDIIRDSAKGVADVFDALKSSGEAYEDSLKSANNAIKAATDMTDDHGSIRHNWGSDVKTGSLVSAYNAKGYNTKYGSWDGTRDGFLNLSPEALKALKSLPEWQDFLADMRKEVDSSSYDAFIAAIDNKIGLIGKENEALYATIERFTGSSFGALVDEYKNAIKNMETKTSDFGNFIQEKINNALAESVMDKNFSERLNKLQEFIATAAEDGFDESEIAYIKAEKKAAQEEAKRRQQMMKDSDLYEDTSTNQQASGRGYQQLSEDTGQELNGRATALQIAGESINTTAQLLLTNSNVANTLLTSNNALLSDILTQNSLQTLYLEDIQKDTRKIYNEFSAKLDTMNATLKNI